MYGAPIATVLPSADIDTLKPLWLFVASPNISSPRFTHALVPVSKYHTRTCPRSIMLALLSLYGAPIATTFPSAERLTLVPLWSPLVITYEALPYVYGDEKLKLLLKERGTVYVANVAYLPFSDNAIPTVAIP